MCLWEKTHKFQVIHKDAALLGSLRSKNTKTVASATAQIAIGPAGSWPLWSVRTIIFYGLSVVLWLGYFYAFFRLRRSSAPLRDRNPDRG